MKHYKVRSFKINQADLNLMLRQVWSAMARFINFACDILLTFALSWRLHFQRNQINK